MTDPNQYNPQNPQQAQQYGGYGSYGQNDYGQQAPQYGAPDYGQQAPQYGAPQYSAPQYGNAAGYNQQQPQYGAPQPQPQGSGSFFALTAPLDQPAYNCTIGEAFIRFWKKYATFKGRASRGEFWWWVLCTFIIQIAFAVIFAVLGAIIDSNTANGMQSFVNTIWALATIVPSLALSVRRLHDTNKAGTTLVILYAIDFIGGVLLSVGLVMTGLGAISVIGGGSSSTGAAGILLLHRFHRMPGHVDRAHCAHGQEDRSSRRTLRRSGSRQRLRPSPGHATDRNRTIRPERHSGTGRRPVRSGCSDANR